LSILDTLKERVRGALHAFGTGERSDVGPAEAQAGDRNTTTEPTPLQQMALLGSQLLMPDQQPRGDQGLFGVTGPDPARPPGLLDGADGIFGERSAESKSPC
jgi:hypothetical protein